MDTGGYEQRYMAAEGLRADVSVDQMYEGLAYSDERNDLLSTTLDNTTLLETIEKQLKGKAMVIKGGRAEWVQFTPPVMNDAGINAILQYIMTMSGPGQILANLAEHDMYSALKYLAQSVVIELVSKSDDYALDDAARDRVVIIVMHNAKNFMSRGVGRQEGKDVYGRTKAIEHLQRTSSEKERGKGLFGLFGGGE